MDDRFWDERYAAAELIWTAEPNRFLVAEVTAWHRAGAHVACGEGRNAVWLATGMGRDRRRLRAGLDKARRLAQLRHVTVEWVLADVTTYQPPPAAFDLVAVLYLQLPAEPLAAALANAQGALRSVAPSWWSATTPPTSPTATAAPKTPPSSTAPTTSSPASAGS